MKSIGNKPIFPPFLGWETFLFKVDTSKECQDLGVTCERWDILKGTERDVLVHIYIYIYRLFDFYRLCALIACNVYNLYVHAI